MDNICSKQTGVLKLRSATFYSLFCSVQAQGVENMWRAGGEHFCTDKSRSAQAESFLHSNCTEISPLIVYSRAKSCFHTEAHWLYSYC